MVDYVRLGGTGLEVSEVCLGTWMFGHTAGENGSEVVDRTGALSILDAAWERGVNFFDTANVYGRGRSEQYIGEWLQGKDRENFVIASKVFFALAGRQQIGLSRKAVMAEIEGTLRRLGTDYLDVYYIHAWHDSYPIEEVLTALNDLVRSGKVHYIGVSNFATWQLVMCHSICVSKGYSPISLIQPRYNAVDNFPYTVDPEEMPLPDLFDACRYYDIAVCPYSPLAGGFLTGKYERGDDGEVMKPEGSRGATIDEYGPFPERWWRVLTAVREVAEEVEATPAQVAIRWTMNVPGVASVPIVGATSPRQLDETLKAVDVPLTDEQQERIKKAGELPDLKSHAYIYTD